MNRLLQRMIETGEVKPPTRTDMPDVIEDLAPDIGSVVDILIAEREKERNR